MKHNLCQHALLAAAMCCAVSTLSGAAAAEVTLVKAGGWEVTTQGRMSAFFSYGWGDSTPIAKAGESIPLGAGISTGSVGSPGPTDANGNLQQGHFATMRVRSGFAPNVLGFSVRHQINDTTNLELHSSFWATIETESMRKTAPPITYLQEGYAKLTGTWGAVTAGRSLDLFSRGATQTDFLYGHGYGLGFGGEIDNYGPSNGLIGFGVIASFFAPGIVYETPQLAGLQLTAGVYDPAPLTGGYEVARSVRPETEVTYDAGSGPYKLHVFANGAFQKVNKTSSDTSATSAGLGYGFRTELGNFHVGASGHYGKGLGLHYALESSSVSVSPKGELRTFDGYSLLLQYVLGRFDLNAGGGISRVFLLDSDKANASLSVTRYEAAYYGGIVYHYTPNYHVDIDYLRANTRWRFGEKQDVNFLNFGLTATW